MAHFSIISSQTGLVIFEGAPRYVGAYLKPGYLEFQEIGSPVAIDWHVGDYVAYSRTGKTYRLYRTPQTVEQGQTLRYGAAFLYENVQFYDDSKQLELCPFTDLVPGDNTIHFSTQNIVSFFGKPLNVAERLQACLEAQYGVGTWEVRIVTTSDADLLELLDTEVEFSVSGANCQQVLEKVYETWSGLGWVHTVEQGVNVITIGASNVRTAANTTAPFTYGDGLVRVERSIANADEIGTRLFAYGSMKNMDATYYRGLDIKDAESVDIEHLMIPLANWGITDGKPDARKAYIENAAAISALGLIPKTAYFDGTGDLPDIHPTIERMTIGEVYDAGGAGYIPSLSKWSRSQRVDELVSASNPEDHGTTAEQGQRFTESIDGTLPAHTENFLENDSFDCHIFTATTTHAGLLSLRFGQNAQVFTLTSDWTPTFQLYFNVNIGGAHRQVPLEVKQTGLRSFALTLPESINITGATAGRLDVSINGWISRAETDPQGSEGDFVVDPSTTISGGIEYEIVKEFSVTIPQIGFDIEKYAALGNGKTISMRTGMCAGRDFEIKDATYVSATDSWRLALYRSIDDDLNIMFPNADYEIAAGDQYVLLDIAMPEMYVTVASQRLLEAAQRLLADISVERPFYSPKIDAKVVINENRVLREGMWMDLTFESTREYVLVDSITIDEDGSNIPTYEVALRQYKGIDWTESIGSSGSRSSVSVNENEQEANGTVTSVGMTVPEGMTVDGSPIQSAGIFRLGLKPGFVIPTTEQLASYFQLNGSLASLIELRAEYSYLGAKNGLFFAGATLTGTPVPDLYVDTVNGQRVLRSPLPLITGGDQIVIGGTPGSGGGGGGATKLWGLDDVDNALANPTLGMLLAWNGTKWTGTNVSGLASGNLLSWSGNGWTTVAASSIGRVYTEGTGIDITGNVISLDVSSASTALGLGAAASYAVATAVTQADNTHLVTGGAVHSAINDAVASALKFQGVTTTAISDGSTTNPVTINGQPYTAKKGDVVLYDGKEYLWTGSAWEQLGDEASWALKTTTISAGTGLEGGGSLAANRTIRLSDATQASLALADTALQSGDIKALTLKIGTTTVGSYTPTTAKTLTITAQNLYDTIGGTKYAPYHYGGYVTIDTAQTISGKKTFSHAEGIVIGSANIWWDSSSGALRIDQPLITEGDQIVISGTPGGGGGGGATNLKELEDVYHNASGVRRYSSGNATSTDLLGYDSTKGWYAVQLGSNLTLTNGVLNAAGGGSNLTAGYAISIAQSAISVAHTNEDSDPISFDPDTHTGLDASNLVEWGVSTHTDCAKLTIGVGSDSPVSKDVVLASGYDYLLGLINSQVAGVSSVAGKTGAVTLEIADVTGLQTALNSKQAAGNYLTSVPLATSDAIGGIQIGYTQSGKNYPVQLSSNKAYVYVPWENTTYSNATTSAAGLMSATDKTKLNGIAEGANNYSLPTASSSTLGGIKIGTGLTIDSSGVVSVTGQTVGTVTGISVNGGSKSPDSSGVITLDNYWKSGDSRTANTVLAAPNGSNGAATFRALVAADIPTLTKSKISDFPTNVSAFTNDAGYITSYTNTWRNIYTGGTSRVGTGTDTKAINFVAGTGIAISYQAAGSGSGQSGDANYFNIIIGVTANTYQPLDSDLTAIAAISSGTGLLKRSVSGTTVSWSIDTNTYLTSHQTLYNLVINNSAGTAQITYKPGTSGTYSLTLTKAMVGLGNVEDTALSTWAGTTNITTLGTITSGTWSGSTIAVNKGGTGLTTWTGAYRIIYSTAATTLTTLAPNSTTTRKFLRQVGANNAATAPAWDTVTKDDVGLGNVPNWVYTIKDSSAQNFVN